MLKPHRSFFGENKHRHQEDIEDKAYQNPKNQAAYIPFIPFLIFNIIPYSLSHTLLIQQIIRISLYPILLLLIELVLIDEALIG